VFRADEGFSATGVAVREVGETIVCDVAGGAPLDAVKAQVVRMLGLEPGCEGWPGVGERDPVVGRLQSEFPGFFTAAKASPYDAAAWAVIAQGLGIVQAALVKTAIARDLGERIELDGALHDVFPSPAVLAGVRRVAGLSDEKVSRLRGVARAALEGRLDAARLRTMGEEAALTDLQTLRGVGPWAASHVYFRGAAPPDGLPTAEPRVLLGLAHARGCDLPSEDDFKRMAERWRPFRMWVCVLLSRHLARSGGWRTPGLRGLRGLRGAQRARARAGAPGE
jgi:DNA-3-methyladenine glycosylase II